MVEKSKKKMGLFGGTFDPIHTGHLIVVELIRDELQLDQIIFIPTKKHPLKDNKSISPETDRLAMIRFAIEDNPYLSLSDMEVKKDSVSYTVDTIRAFRELYPPDEYDLFFLMGMDNINQLHLWKEPDTLLQLCRIVAFGRPGFELHGEAERFLPYIETIQIPLLEISSSYIRKRIQAGRSIRYLVPAKVEAYIRQKHLYQEGALR